MEGLRMTPAVQALIYFLYFNCIGKVCDKPLLNDARTFPYNVFSGSGSSSRYKYARARITNVGWCPSMSDPYLLLDLQKEYHITRVVVMGDRNQTKWSESYSMKYSRDTSYKNSEQVFIGDYIIKYFAIKDKRSTKFLTHATP